MDRGFTRVRPLEGGLDAWADAGYGIEAPQEDDTVIGIRRPAGKVESPS
jgi:3-mercaptopyruvate sulfurtransferase SseA